MSESELLKALAALKAKEAENYAEKFKPYQEQLDFLNANTNTSVLIGGNRTGKTLTGSYAITCHLTGNYPSWWGGVRFLGPVNVWVAGVTSQRVRDTVQEKLFGRLGRTGTGMIPKSSVLLDSIIKKTGTPMAIDRVDIKHESGGLSNVQFFSYEMDREKFQGSSVEIVWFDEEPPEDIYNECKMRVLDCQGNIFFTFTPLSGMTPLYDNLMQDESIRKVFLSMDDAKHLKEEDINRLLEGMSDSEKRARRHGVATIGAGKIFNFAEEEYTIEPFEIPAHWRRLGGLDVGLTHPTGAVMACIDDDSRTVYITNEYRVQNKTAIDHAAHLKHWGVKFMTDPSAFHRQIGSGISTASIYQDEGLDLERANNDVDASISEIRKLIGSGRLYIFSTCTMLLKELRTYRTKETSDGKSKIVKTNDDCFAGDTMVPVKGIGWVAIRDLVGKEFETLSPLGWATAGSVKSKGIQEVIRASFSDGTYLDVTGDHELLCYGRGFLPLTHIGIGDILVSGGINHGNHSSARKDAGVQRKELLQVWSLFLKAAKGRWKRAVAQGRLGILSWSYRRREDAHSPYRWQQVEQPDFKSGIDSWFKASEPAHDSGAKGPVEREYQEGHIGGTSVARFGGRESLALGQYEEDRRVLGDAGLYLRMVWRNLSESWLPEVFKGGKAEVLLPEPQDGIIPRSSEEGWSSGRDNGGREGVRSLREELQNKQTIELKTLLSPMHSKTLKSKKSIGKIEVFDLTVDNAHCFITGAGVITSNCIDPMRYVLMAVEEKAEVPKRFRKKPDIKKFRAADKRVGY